MKKFGIFLSSLILIAAAADCTAQEESVLLRAMKDELARNTERLSLEGVSAPFFISYQVKDMHSTSIRGTAGAITQFDTSHTRRQHIRVLVGDYTQTQENYVGTDLAFSFENFSASLPLEDNYDAIRRELWLGTDRAYKNATEQLEKKRAALRQQQIPEEYSDLPDFAHAESITQIAEPVHASCDLPAARDRVRRLSAIFTEYPDIYNTDVTLSLDEMMVYFINSEGTVVAEPRTLASIVATAATQAEDGEPLVDFVAHHALLPGQLPDESALAEEIRAMAQRLANRRSAPTMDDTYTGPVLFLDQSVPELFTRLYLGEEGLIASRMPVMEGPLAMLGSQMRKRNLGDKLDKRVLPIECSITSTPSVRSYEDKALIGSYAIDAEGVVPPENMMLVENGKAAALLANRIPTPHSKESNGHLCLGIGTASTDGISPGVLDVRMDEGPSADEMKELLLERARDEGLNYAYIVRRIRPETIAAPSVDDDLATRISMFGMSAGPGASPLGEVTSITRVTVADGSETPVRSVEVLRPGSSALRRMTASGDRAAWNCTMEGDSPIPGMGAFLSIGRSIAGMSGGLPVSIIAPRAVILDDMEVRKEKRPITPKPPIVQSPLAD